jgi:hypothetical protein
MQRAFLAIVFLSVSTSALGADSIAFGPAPEGDPKAVALKIIRANFDPPDCPKVSKAVRLSEDKSIRATCSNGEVFRVATMEEPGSKKKMEIAMKCSAARKMGIKGC